MKLYIKYFTILFLLQTFIVKSQIPLPEHPRPDFQREMWKNLNGQWDFKFDPNDIGEKEKWQEQRVKFDKKIIVPFPWGSKLSEVKDEANIAWYNRKINVSKDWKGKKTFITIGASDWETTVWIDGNLFLVFKYKFKKRNV